MNYYSERLAQYGLSDVRALGWGSVESQQLRFRVLCEIADLRGHSILDFGCGFGDLYDFMGRPEGYVGCDDNPEMLKAACARYPTAKFVSEPEHADYILASGVFNLNRSWQGALFDLWNSAQLGMAVNFTSSLAKYKQPGIEYVDPLMVIEQCMIYSKRFALRHDYKENDCTIYVYK